MAEVNVAGAFGAPERVDLDQVKHALQQAPDLLQHLAHLVIKGRFDDGQPVSTDVQSTPGRIAPLDQIDALFKWLWQESEYWGTRAGFMSLDYMVRLGENLQVLGPRGVVGTPEGGDILQVWGTTLVNRILDQWETITIEFGAANLWGQMEARAWLDDVDEHLLKPLAMWSLESRKPVPARPRQCPVCGRWDVWADLDSLTTVCKACKKVVEVELWMSVKEAARILGVAERTIRDWMADELPSRPHGRGRAVELGAARAVRDMRAARSMLNLENPPSAGSAAS